MKTHNWDGCRHCYLMNSKKIKDMNIRFIETGFNDRKLFKCLLDNAMYNTGEDSRGMSNSTMEREFLELKDGNCDGWHNQIIVAFHEDVPVGYVFDAECGINRYVKPEYRKMGICHEMLDVMFPNVKIGKLLQKRMYYINKNRFKLV